MSPVDICKYVQYLYDKYSMNTPIDRQNMITVKDVLLHSAQEAM